MLKKEEYLKTVRRPYPPLYSGLFMSGYSHREQYEPFLHEAFEITNMALVDKVYYYSKADVDRGNSITLASWSDRELFAFVQQEFERREKRLLAAVDEDFEAFCDAYQAYAPSIILIYVIENPLETALFNALSKKLTPEAAKDLLDRLNVPLRDNYYKQEEYELVMATDVAAHVKKYEWLYTRYDKGNLYTVEDAQLKLKSIDKEAFLRKREREKQELIKTITDAKNLLGESAYLVDIFQYCVYFRTQRTDVFNQVIFLARPLLTRKAQSLGLRYEELLCCAPEEILQQRIPERTILEERMRDCTLLLENHELRYLSGDDSTKVKKLFEEDGTGTQTIQGVVASRGIVQGSVKRVLGSDDFFKVEEGDILVTAMTSPNMIPIMKRAAAFVTDEGGVTCHAAIIAREMKKPCIIGTKIATQVLKDGDLVEVDADEGVVRILK